MSDPLDAVADILRDARRVLFITGAGISADSGLPTYRGIGGLYEERDTEDGFPVEVALSGEMFQERPDLTWRHIQRIEEACRHATFNRAHGIIADLERGREVVVLTQNVEGFHRRAGSTRVIDLHGEIWTLMCTGCDWTDQVTEFSGLDLPPRCPSCGAVVRPDVVLFGEMLDERRVRAMYEERARGFDVVLSVGTSSLFPYIVDPVLEAARAGVPTVEINPGDTDISGFVDYKISQGAAAAMEALWERLSAR